jgi:RHS repeat-associated protein
MLNAKLMLTSIGICLASSLFIATQALALPDVKFSIQTRKSANGIDPYPTETEVTSGWSSTYSSTVSGVTGNLTHSGSVSMEGSIGSLTCSMSSEASGSFPGTQRLTLLGDTRAWTSILGGKTATISVGMSAEAAADLGDGTGLSSGVYVEGLSSELTYSNSSTASVTVGPNGGIGEDSTSGSYSYVDHGNCAGGTSYRKIYFGRNTAFTDSQSNFDGLHSGSSDLSYQVSIGTADPIAQIDGPKVGGVLTLNPSAGSTVTFSNPSYDPDDVETTPTNGLGICVAAWVLTDPEGNITTGSSLTSFSSTVLKVGPYTLSLTVTDNEGQQDDTSITFDVGPARECNPHKPPLDFSCSDKDGTLGGDPYCGNASFTLNDPARTRTDSLRNLIRLNSRELGLTVYDWMGNGLFTYGMQVAKLTSGSGGGTPSDPQRILVDGFGYKYDYGLSSSGSSPKTAGVFPTLTESSSGYTLEGAGRITQVFEAGNFVYQFDLDGKLLSVTDPDGNEQTLSYDTSGRPTLVTDLSSDRTIEFQYGTNGKVEKVIENGGFAYRQITYDSSDRIASLDTKDASDVTIRSVAITYDLSGRISSVTRDNDSATTATFSYVNGGHGYELANVSFPTSSVTFNYFSSVGNGAALRTSVSNTKGGEVLYDYDSTGNLIAVREPTYNGGTAGVVHTYTYDSNRNLLTSSNGTTTRTYTYNSLGLPTREEDTRGEYREYTYSGVDLTSVTDNLGTLAELAYTDSSLPHALTAFTDGDGNTWSIAHNTYGQVTSITPPTGSPTGAMTFEYEESSSSPDYGYLRTVTNGAGDVATVDSYTSLGDPTSITTNPSSGVTHTVQMAYDALQRETSFTQGDGKTIETSYTGANATGSTDEAGTLTESSYCAECGKLTGTSGPMSWALAWVLDGDKDISSFEDALSHTTTYTYGSARELKQITYPDSTTLKYQYDNYGRLKKNINGRNHTLTLTYNTSGEVTNDGIYAYTYDNAGQLLTATGTYDVVTYAYTDNRLVESITYDFTAWYLNTAQVVEYTYNPDQTVDTLTWKNGTTTVAQWTYDYDGAGRVSSIVNNFSETTGFTYDGEGKLLTQSNQNGTSRQYTYNDQRGWPTVITHKSGSTTTGEYTLTYDDGADTVGNLTDVSELNGATVSYGYDDLYRLTSEARTGTPSFSRTIGYDLAGNPTTRDGTTFATYDSANKFQAVLSKSVYHDYDGNITSLAATSPLSFSAATWDDFNRMTQVRKTGASTVDYQYMYNGKRWGSKQYGQTRVYYIFAGDALIGELIGQTPSVAYTWGPDGLVSKRNLSASASSWYELGPQGETRTLTNSAGAATDTYYYSAYGDLISSTGSTTNPYRYGGKFGYYTEVYSGLILATHRWYSPTAMRWISRDPIKYAGGVNLYEYVHGRATKYADPQGTTAGAIAIPIGEIGGVIGGGTIGGVVAPVAGVIGGVASLYCIIHPDECKAAYEGMCADDSAPTADDRADDLRKHCSVKYRIDTEQCYKGVSDREACLEKARQSFIKCLARADGLVPVIK